MAQVVVEDQNGRARNVRGSGGTVECTETGGVRNAEEILKDDEFVDANRKVHQGQ